MVLPVRVLTKLGSGLLDGVPLCGVASVRGWATGLHLHYRKEIKSIREPKRVERRRWAYWLRSSKWSCSRVLVMMAMRDDCAGKNSSLAGD